MPANQRIANEFTQQLMDRGFTVGESKQRVRGATAALAPSAVINTQGMRSIDLLRPDPGQIQLDDIAHGLSSICRFSGQTNPFYSVAQHSLMVARLVPPRLRLRALLHDASEAYIQDIPSPLKALLPEYTAIEARLMKVIHQVFRIPHDPTADAVVKEADRTALMIEQRDLFPPSLETIDASRRESLQINPRDCLPPERVRPIFLHQCLEAARNSHTQTK